MRSDALAAAAGGCGLYERQLVQLLTGSPLLRRCIQHILCFFVGDPEHQFITIRPKS